MSDPIFNPQELIELRAYLDPLYLANTIQEVLVFVFWAVWLRFLIVPAHAWAVGAAARLQAGFPAARTIPVVRALPAILDRVWKGSGWGATLLFTGALCASDLIWLPSNFYFGYLREHAFGLSNEALGRYFWDYGKGVVIGLLTMCTVAFGMFGLARRLPKWWLIIGCIGAGALAVSAALDPYRAQVFFDQTPLPPGEVREGITELMRKAQIDFRDVVVEKTLVNTVRVQAYFAGKGPTRTIVVNDALLKNLSTDEVLAAVGHEAGHVHESRWAGQVASTLALLVCLFAIEQLFRLTARRRSWGITERADVRTLPVILCSFAVCNLCIVPISTGVQRQREREADRYGLELTQNPDAFRRMLVKAARINKMDPDPPRWRVIKGWSHPPIQERLAAVDAWKKTE